MIPEQQLCILGLLSTYLQIYLVPKNAGRYELQSNERFYYQFHKFARLSALNFLQNDPKLKPQPHKRSKIIIPWRNIFHVCQIQILNGVISKPAPM